MSEKPIHERPIGVSPRRLFWFANGPTEMIALPAIYMDDPNGGDPILICTISRVLRPDLLYEICNTADQEK